MRSEAFFRIGTIDAALTLKLHLEQWPGTPLDTAVRQLQCGAVSKANLDYQAGIELIGRIGLQRLDATSERGESLRSTLFNMARELRPFWATMSPLGRARSERLFTADQRQCFRYAKLLSPEVDEAWEWWDRLASHFRHSELDMLLEDGRLGERLTIEYEKRRLKGLGSFLQPKWIAIEDNFVGYDVQSYEVGGEKPIDKFIEVKATNKGAPEFHLSREQWNFATAHPDSYELHLWYLPTTRMRIWKFPDLLANMPVDSGSGKWESALLRCEMATLIPMDVSIKGVTDIHTIVPSKVQAVALP